MLCEDPPSIKFHCYLPRDLSSGNKSAEDWADTFNGPVNGKWGGRDPMASGSGANIDGVDEALALAEEFAKLYI